MIHSETFISMMSILCRTHKRRSSYEKLTAHAEDHPSTPPPPSGAPHSQSSTCYLHKAMPAGILLLKLSFREQYFCVEMYVCENTRLGIPVNKHVRTQSYFPLSCNSHLYMLLKHEKISKLFDCIIIIIIISQMSTRSKSNTFPSESRSVFYFIFFTKVGYYLMIELKLLH